MSSDVVPAAGTPERTRTEAGQWYGIAVVGLVVAAFLAVVALTVDGVGERAQVVWLLAAVALGLVSLTCLMVGAVITGTTIALRAERARRD